MEKSYSTTLANWVRMRTSTRHARNEVAFLAVRDDVKVAVAAGFTAKTVWAHMRETGRIDFSYDTFLRYMKRFVLASDGDQASDRTGETQAKFDGSRQNESKPPRIPPLATNSSPVRGFTINPIPRKEDLI